MMAEKLYTLRLTSDEVWILREQYEAAFTDPGSMSDVEREVSKKLDALTARRHRDRLKGAR